MVSRADPTDVLRNQSEAECASLANVFPLVYEELRHLARRQLRREPSDNTLTTTALVHEAYLRLVNQRHVDWGNRAQFMGIAATAMRRILVDHARGYRSAKRSGAFVRVTFDDLDLAAEDHAELLVTIDEALDQLASLDARQARIVECRFFGGLTEEETAESVGVSIRTVKRDWAKARSWLYQAIYPDDLG